MSVVVFFVKLVVAACDKGLSGIPKRGERRGSASNGAPRLCVSKSCKTWQLHYSYRTDKRCQVRLLSYERGNFFGLPRERMEDSASKLTAPQETQTKNSPLPFGPMTLGTTTKLNWARWLPVCGCPHVLSPTIAPKSRRVSSRLDRR